VCSNHFVQFWLCLIDRFLLYFRLIHFQVTVLTVKKGISALNWFVSSLSSRYLVHFNQANTLIRTFQDLNIILPLSSYISLSPLIRTVHRANWVDKKLHYPGVVYKFLRKLGRRTSILAKYFLQFKITGGGGIFFWRNDFTADVCADWCWVGAENSRENACRHVMQIPLVTNVFNRGYFSRVLRSISVCFGYAQWQSLGRPLRCRYTTVNPFLLWRPLMLSCVWLKIFRPL
jgi:hypothetical protein